MITKPSDLPAGYRPHRGTAFDGEMAIEREVIVMFRNGRTGTGRKPVQWTWRWMPNGPHDFDIVGWKYA